MLTYKELQEKGICWPGYKRKKGTTPYDDGSCVKEELEQHHAMAFGRMNPITSGHEAVVNKLHSVAKEHGASHNLIVSHSQDAKKNPLTGAQKVVHAKNAFPDTNISAASKEAPTILHHAAAAHAAGATHLHVVAGSDRHEEMHNLLHKYNGKDSAHGHYNFKKITVHSSGERDPDSEGTTGISASKMREHATAGNKAEFHKGAPSSMKPEHKDAMYNDVRKGMNIKENLEEAHKLGDKVVIHKGPSDVIGKTGRIGEIRKRYIGGAKTYTIDHDHGSIQLKSTHFKSMKEETMDQQSDRAAQLKQFNDQMTKLNGPNKDTELGLDKTEKAIMFGKKKPVNKTEFGLSKKEQDNLADVNEVLRPEMGAGAYVNDFIKSTNPRFNNKSKEERRRMAIGAFMNAKANTFKEEIELGEMKNHQCSSHEVWEMGINPSTGTQRSKDGTDYKVASFATRDKAARHAGNLGGEKHGVYTKHVKEDVVAEASSAKDTTIGKKSKSFKFFNGQVEPNTQMTVKESMTGNPGNGYHGACASPDDQYKSTHKHVKNLTDGDDKTVKHYLDSAHGRHLAGRENDHDYIKNDFNKFKKNYRPEMHASVQKGVNVDKVNSAGQEPHEEKFETVKKTKLKKEETMKSYKEFLQVLDETLIGKQKKLDKNHNGKLDSQDFKMLRKEEVEELDEKSAQAKQNKTMKNMMDADRGEQWKVQNKVTTDQVRDWDNKHPSSRSQNVAIGRALRKEEVEELDEIKMSDLPSRSIKGKSYGASYEDPEGEFETKDSMNKPAKAAGRKIGQSVGSYKRRQPKAA